MESEVGTGTTFDVYLPRTSKEVTVGTGRRVSGAEEFAGGNETILLVDDEEHILEALGEKLRDLGYKVITANTGSSAIEIMKKKRKKIDLVVLDYVLPDITGIEVYQFMKSSVMRAKTIMHTGKDLKEKADFLEGVEIFRKPTNLNSLCLKIREMLGYDLRQPFRSSISRVRYYYLDEKTLPYDEVLENTETVYKLFRKIAFEPQEKFLVLYLDSRNRIIAYEDLAIGTVNKAAVYPREVVKGAIFANASSIILLHNHPSDDLTPSNTDIFLTASIMQACRLFEITVQDHLIIGKNEYYSFSQRGDL